MSTYLSSPDKIAGNNNQEQIVQRACALLRKQGYIVDYEWASSDEDKKDKIDFFLNFDKSTPFEGVFRVPVDVKSAKTCTVITDNTGEDALNKSKSMYLIINSTLNYEELWWISVNRLRECRKLYPFKLEKSHEIGNASYFIYIFDYVNEHKDFFRESARKYIM